VTTLCSQPEAFTSDLGDDQSCYLLLMLCLCWCGISLNKYKVVSVFYEPWQMNTFHQCICCLVVGEFHAVWFVVDNCSIWGRRSVYTRHVCRGLGVWRTVESKKVLNRTDYLRFSAVFIVTVNGNMFGRIYVSVRLSLPDIYMHSSKKTPWSLCLMVICTLS